MCKFLCSIAFVLSFLSVNAQSQNPQKEIQSLVQKVDSLEHELSYLRLSYDLYTLNSDITTFANEVYARYIAIKLDINNRNLNYLLGNSFNQYYESCLRKKESLSELIEVRKTSIALNIMTYPYSESEQKTLMAAYNIIDQAYSLLENSMKLLKITIDAYKELL